MATSVSSIDYGGYRYSVGDVIMVNTEYFAYSIGSSSASTYMANAMTKQWQIKELYIADSTSTPNFPVSLTAYSGSGSGCVTLDNIVAGSGGTPLFTVGTASVKAYDTRNDSYPSTGGWFESAMINWSGFAGTSENPIVDYHIYYRETNDAGNTPNQNGWSTWLIVTDSAGTSGSFKIGSVNQGSSDLSWGNRNQWYQFCVIGILKDGNNTGWSCTTNWLRKSNAYVQVFNGNNATSGSTSSIYQFSGYPIVMPSCGFTKTGYTFSGWTESSNNTGTVYTAKQRVSGLSDATRNWWAKWTPISYKITYDENGGSSVSDKTYTIETDLTLSSAPTKKGYSFNGWKLSNTVGNWIAKTYSVSAHMGTGKYGNITLVAQWKIIDYSITYALNDGTVSSENPAKYNIETETFTLNNPTKTGYTFTGWTDGNGVTSMNVSVLQGTTGNLSFTANWIVHKLTVNYYSNYATEANFADNYELLNEVSKDVNVLVHSREFKYDTEYNTGLHNYSESGNVLYMKRLGYTATGNWGTSPDGGTLIGEDDSFSSGQAMAEKVGLSLASDNTSINLYAQWNPANIVFYRPPSDSWHLCNSYFRPPNSDWKPAIMFKKIKDTWYRSILK